MYHGQRWIGGWRWTAKLEHWLRALPKLARERTPHRSIPRHIKEKMRDARAVRP